MKERSSGKLTSTSRSSRTDAFRINFDLLENPITSAGENAYTFKLLMKTKCNRSKGKLT